MGTFCVLVNKNNSWTLKWELQDMIYSSNPSINAELYTIRILQKWFCSSDFSKEQWRSLILYSFR